MVVSKRYQLLHAVWARFPLVKPLHDRTRTIENEASTANVGHHSSFGFLPKPLKTGPAFCVPDNF
jgi:hypothetical protein